MGEAQSFPHLSAQDCFNVDIDELTREVDAVERLESSSSPLETVAKPSVKRSDKKTIYPNWDNAADDRPCCHYCGKRFTPKRSNQKFCNPSRERKANFERRQALIAAVAAQLATLELKAADMGLVAQKCVNADYDWWLGAMGKIGWVYSKHTKRWAKAKGI